jgi:hypothetical protein
MNLQVLIQGRFGVKIEKGKRYEETAIIFTHFVLYFL